ncbi:ATP-binding protein [Streptomyces sp. NBC_00690]|uniref:ATP-binding protein n=1 Tax=Streptomyces sp. NBC_00690 TaxID=2975808 RepID=UPI002E2B13F3|nr:ATP-binding protein [Streptomyces sp. NBC_00690]
MNTPLRDLLASWPGRFRHRGVLLALHGGAEEPVPSELGLAVLDGFGRRDPAGTCEQLILEGEFTVAEVMLKDCPDLGPRTRDLRQLLVTARTRSLEVTRLEGRTHSRRAAAAGVDFALDDIEDIGRTATSSWPRALALLGRRAAELAGLIEERERELRKRIAGHEGTTPTPGPALETLIKAGHLSTVRSLLDLEPTGVPLPESVPPLRAWTWREDSPEDLLRCHLDPSRHRPAGFSRWEAADGAGPLLEAYGELHQDSVASVARFAAALGRFLGDDGPEPAVDRFEGGYLTSVGGLFTGAPLSRLHPTGRIDLFVASPDTDTPPAGLVTLPPHLAVGPALERSGYLDRQRSAVVTLRDMLRLVVVSEHRAASLVRVAAQQWPVTALTGETAKEFHRVLGGDSGTRWQTLRWILDLTATGDAVTADVMSSCTEMDAGLLLVMLDRAGRSEGRGWWGTPNPDLHVSWQEDIALMRSLEDELLSRCPDIAAQVAFWAALTVGTADGRADLDDMVAMAESSVEGRDAGAAVVNGAAALEGNGTFVRDASGDLLLRPCGVTRALASIAEERLTRAAQRLPTGASGQSARAELDMLEGWHSNRYLLTPSFRDHQLLVRSGNATQAELLESTRAVRADTQAAAPVGSAGTAVLDILLASMAAELRGHRPEVRVEARAPDRTRIDLGDDSLRVILYELLENAAEAVGPQGGGTVQAFVTQEYPDVIVDIRDSGPGLPPEVHGREHQVFRRDWSTRGPGRGAGLFRVRHILRQLPGGEADITAVPGEPTHPTLRGAHFRLVLPAADYG